LEDKFYKLFGTKKPIIAMVHLGALPGSPLYNKESGITGLIKEAKKDLEALQTAKFDAIMFGNENDRPYQLNVDTASTAAAAYIIGELKRDIKIPFGVDMLWDPMATIALGTATKANFVREIFTGTYSSDMGIWAPNAGEALRYKQNLGSEEMLLLFNISAEFAYSQDRRPLTDRARSVVFSSLPDAILVSGQITGEAASMHDLMSVKKALPFTPVLANTGVKHDTVIQVLKTADGCIVGSSLKEDGNTWKPVDPKRARDFMNIVSKFRK
jgi:membrane complex biogenesis BtpA family protein